MTTQTEKSVSALEYAARQAMGEAHEHEAKARVYEEKARRAREAAGWLLALAKRVTTEPTTELLVIAALFEDRLHQAFKRGKGVMREELIAIADELKADAALATPACHEHGHAAVASAAFTPAAAPTMGGT